MKRFGSGVGLEVSWPLRWTKIFNVMRKARSQYFSVKSYRLTRALAKPLAVIIWIDEGCSKACEIQALPY
ncbi:MAG: hypothetical protein IPP36_07475 [Nitrosomonadales bacterium]|nr:hypothetical protein [Nitrosomonadales bacterium]